MKIVMLGPPGAGKGTYASRLTKYLGIPHISTGDIVRSEIEGQTELGKKIKEYSDKGDLVPDRIMIMLLKNRLEKPDCNKGFIIDGFPRTFKQAKALYEISEIDIVINLVVPDQIIISRLSNRVTCRRCGEIFNLVTLKPKKEGICDKCNSHLFQRSDDRPQVIKERLAVYRRKNEQLIEFYLNKKILENVNCDSLLTTPEEIVKEITGIIECYFLIKQPQSE